MKEKEPLWTVSFILDTTINFFVFLMYYLLIVIIAVVAKDTLHATASEAGLAVGIYIIGTIVARLMAGHWVSVYGCRRMLYVGLGLTLLSTIMYLYIPTLWLLHIVRFINGFSYGVTSTATSTIVATIIPESRRGEGINYYGLSTSLAAAIGPFIGILLLHATGFVTVIGLCIVLGVLCVAGALMMKFDEPEIPASLKHKTLSITDFIESKVYSISLVAVLVGFAYSGVIGFMASYTREIGMVIAGTFFFVVYATVVTVTRPLLGIVFDMKGENFVLYPCYISLALGIYIFSIATTTWAILVSAVFIGLGYGTFMSNGQAVTIKMVPVHRIGVATSTYFIALDFGLGVGPYVLGMVKESVGYTDMFQITAIVSLLALATYYALYGRLVGTAKDPAVEGKAADSIIHSYALEGKQK